MDILEPILIQALDNAFSLGLLVAAVWWFKKRDEKKDSDIAELNKEYRASMEENLNKMHSAFVDSTTTLKTMSSTFPIMLRDAVKEGIKNA